MTEDKILAVMVGTPDKLNGPVEIVPYDSSWPERFDRLGTEIRETLGETVLLLEHVGSTSVPGLAAKPIIDVVLGVADAKEESSYVAPLEMIGYRLVIREPDWYQHRLLKTPGIDGNLHVFSIDCPEIKQMMLFRDWLRSNDVDRRLYESTKYELAKKTWTDIQNYADAKSDVVKSILLRANQTR